jgi:DNA polymerase-3 subunit delta
MAAPGATWLVDGDDTALVSEEVRRLVGELAGNDPGLTVEDFWGEEVDLDAVVLACETPPFLADRRVVVLREAGRYTTEDLTALLTYLEHPLPTTVLIVAGGGGKLAPRLVASVKKAGHVVVVGPGRDGRSWMEARLKRVPLQFEPAARTLLATHLGADLGRLPALLDVLVASYGEGSRLTVDDLDPFLGEAGGVAPWDLTDAIDKGDAAAALDALHRLLGSGDRHPLVVLAILHRHVAAMLQLDGAGPLSEAQAAERLGIAKGRSTFPARKALSGARKLGSDGIARAIHLLADADVDLRGESTWPAEAILDVLVARLARLAPRASRAPRGPRQR